MRDDAHGQLDEGEVDVVAALLMGDERAKVAEPGMCPLDLPSVSTEAVVAFDAASDNARG